MADQGCNLILHSRTKEGTKKVLEEVLAKGVNAFSVNAELSNMNEVDDMLKYIDNCGAVVDVVLNNAGLQIAYRTDYLATPMEDYDKSFLINTMAPMKICYHYLPKMMERGFGRIVNTTSGIALEAEQAGYSASKAALNKVTIDLGYKLNGSDVIISLTDPGWCRTDLGGPNAPNAPESTIPGIVVGAFINDGKSGRLFGAQDFKGMSLEEAVKKAEGYASPYTR
jgi:short-subunit dehydrogenase